MEIRMIDSALFPAFRPYLLPEAAQAIQDGLENIIAVGAVTEDFKTCGAAVCLRDSDSLTLFSLCVDPLVRRQGVASFLLDSLERSAGQPLTDALWVLPDEESKPLTQLLQKRGFAPPVQNDQK